MRILHTADWHLGQNLMFHDRRCEHAAFLDWLVRTVHKERPDALLVAGDVFDTGSPPNYALEMYYNFLVQMSESPCRDVIVTGGNHDSVATLHAPKALLKALEIHVVGGITPDLDDQIIRVLDAKRKHVLGIVCAVPFLRDRDIRQSVAGESYEEKSRAMLDGVRDYYTRIGRRALEIIAELPAKQQRIPLLATGHMNVSGGLTSDGVREIYVGSTGQIDKDDFPEEFNYVGLGHLHYPQTVTGCDYIRFSGSPIPLSFGEADTPKNVLMVDLIDRDSMTMVTEIPVPEFQRLRVVAGTMEQIPDKLKDAINGADHTVWIEVKVDAEPSDRSVEQKIREMVEGLPVELFAVKRTRKQKHKGLTRATEKANLHELSPADVFEKRLALEEDLADEDLAWLRQAFTEVHNKVYTVAEAECES